MKWPNLFPVDCPPDNAEKVDGVYFRLVEKSPPTDADVQSHREAYPDKEWGSKTACCKACGLSVYSKRADAERTRRRIPALRRKLIAVANVTEPSGLLAATPSANANSHCTWWVSPDYNEAHLLLQVESA